MTNSENELARLKNIGPRSAAWLNEIGLYSLEDLAKAGAVSVYFQLKERGYKVSLNMVYAIQGALMDMPWTALPETLKEELKSKINQEQK